MMFGNWTSHCGIALVPSKAQRDEPIPGGEIYRDRIPFVALQRMVFGHDRSLPPGLVHPVVPLKVPKQFRNEKSNSRTSSVELSRVLAAGTRFVMLTEWDGTGSSARRS